MTTAVLDLEAVAEPARAGRLLHPLRLRILKLAREPRSAADMAADLGLPRQKVNYHVRALADDGFLRKAGRRKKGNLYEQRYVATARSYVLSPGMLGDLAADPREVQDRLSAAYLLALAARAQAEVAQAAAEADAQGKRLATLSISADIRFTSAAQRQRFTAALRDAVARVVAEHTSPYEREDGSRARGRPYRLLVGSHPVPPESE